MGLVVKVFVPPPELFFCSPERLRKAFQAQLNSAVNDSNVSRFMPVAKRRDIGHNVTTLSSVQELLSVWLLGPPLAPPAPPPELPAFLRRYCTFAAATPFVGPLARPDRNGKRLSLATFGAGNPLLAMSALPIFQRFNMGMAGTSSSMLPDPKHYLPAAPLRAPVNQSDAFTFTLPSSGEDDDPPEADPSSVGSNGGH
uniref:Uncharacterized protein n=1 Tax=Anopheles culicifacies TaxID=139723 RepID=A0A182MNN3_9DIPT